MPDIRYVCLSDTHFGAATSVLTNLKAGSNEVDGLKPVRSWSSWWPACVISLSKMRIRPKKPTLVLQR